MFRIDPCTPAVEGDAARTRNHNASRALAALILGEDFGVLPVLLRLAMPAEGLALQGGDRTLAERPHGLVVLPSDAFPCACFVCELELCGYKAAHSLRMAVYTESVRFVYTSWPAVYAEVLMPTCSC